MRLIHTREESRFDRVTLRADHMPQGIRMATHDLQRLRMDVPQCIEAAVQAIRVHKHNRTGHRRTVQSTQPANGRRRTSRSA